MGDEPVLAMLVLLIAAALGADAGLASLDALVSPAGSAAPLRFKPHIHSQAWQSARTCVDVRWSTTRGCESSSRTRTPNGKPLRSRARLAPSQKRRRGPATATAAFIPIESRVPFGTVTSSECRQGILAPRSTLSPPPPAYFPMVQTCD